MPVTSSDFIKSAKNSLGNLNEIDYRNAISRAYYAGFHEAKRLLKKQYVIRKKLKNKGSHQEVIDQLKLDSNPDIRTIGIALEICKINRHTADYKLKQNISRSEAQVVIGIIENILKDSNVKFP